MRWFYLWTVNVSDGSWSFAGYQYALLSQAQLLLSVIGPNGMWRITDDRNIDVQPAAPPVFQAPPYSGGPWMPSPGMYTPPLATGEEFWSKS